MSSLPVPQAAPGTGHFATVADGLRSPGWMVIPDFIGACDALLARAVELGPEFTTAAIGRGHGQRADSAVRTDAICWLHASHPVEQQWLALMEDLRLFLNRELFLGLFEYEGQFACYQPGAYYRRHVDAFRGESNRVVSVVLYLNPDWLPGDGGEFVIYPPDLSAGVRFLPAAGTLAVFLSEEFPHEVLAARRPRYSIAGWFRINGTTASRLDPPA